MYNSSVEKRYFKVCIFLSYRSSLDIITFSMNQDMKLDSGRRNFLVILFLTVICLFIYQTNINDEEKENKEIFPVYSFPLKNILDDEATLNVSASHQIFLIETHLDKERILSKPRQACTVESAGEKKLLIFDYFINFNLQLAQILTWMFIFYLAPIPMEST